jgi:hypothetical protein
MCFSSCHNEGSFLSVHIPEVYISWQKSYFFSFSASWKCIFVPLLPSVQWLALRLTQKKDSSPGRMTTSIYDLTASWGNHLFLPLHNQSRKISMRLLKHFPFLSHSSVYYCQLPLHPLQLHPSQPILNARIGFLFCFVLHFLFKQNHLLRYLKCLSVFRKMPKILIMINKDKVYFQPHLPLVFLFWPITHFSYLCSWIRPPTYMQLFLNKSYLSYLSKAYFKYRSGPSVK